MNESIYRLIPVPVEEFEKPPMYRSRHSPHHDLVGSTIGIVGTTQLPGAGHITKKTSAQFGPRTKELPDPHSYLKRGEHSLTLPEPTSFKYAEERKPYVPRKTDKPIMGLKTNKNFITANAVEAILQVPQAMGSSEPNYLAKSDFGKVPEYLSQVKEEIRRENEMIDAYVAEMGGGGADALDTEMNRLSDDDRRDLLVALKSKWDAVNKQYQKMSHVVKLDTVGKIRRKEELEGLLDQLEADIKKLAARGAVFVAE